VAGEVMVSDTPVEDNLGQIRSDIEVPETEIERKFHCGYGNKIAKSWVKPQVDRFFHEGLNPAEVWRKLADEIGFKCSRDQVYQYYYHVYSPKHTAALQAQLSKAGEILEFAAPIYGSQGAPIQTLIKFILTAESNMKAIDDMRQAAIAEYGIVKAGVLMERQNVHYAKYMDMSKKYRAELDSLNAAPESSSSVFSRAMNLCVETFEKILLKRRTRGEVGEIMTEFVADMENKRRTGNV
jgi:hypothetical protein